MKSLSLLIYFVVFSCFTLFSITATAQNLLSQNFDGGTFPPTGWQNNLIAIGSGTYPSGNDNSPVGTNVWQQATTGVTLNSGTNDADPSLAVVHSGTHAAGWNSWNIYNGGTADLVTPAINLGLYPGGTNTLTFYSYRYGSDPIYVYVNTTNNTTGGTLLATLNSSTSSYTLTTASIPSTYTGSVYIIFHAVSSYGYDEYIDDVSVDHVGCSGTPSAATITNAPIAYACSGNTVTLSATDPNTAPGITTVWQQSASATGPWATVTGGSGAATLNYTTPALTTTVYYRFYDSCINSHNANMSNVYPVVVNTSTSISVQPQPTTACVGNNTSFSVTAAGTNLSYQWQVNTGSGFNNITTGGPYTNFTTATLNITGTTLAMNNYQYRVVVTGTCGPLTSNSAVLSVGPTPTITTQPHDSTICSGNGAAFTVAATGAGLTYQWQINTGTGFNNITNGGAYSNATTPTLNIGATFAGMNGYQYQVLVTGACNPSTSNIATLHVNALPAIVTQPVNAITCDSANASFTVAATGAGLGYQWQVNTGSGFNTITNVGVYSGATTNTLSITPATVSMNGYRYRAIITGTCAPIDTTVTDTLKVTARPSVSITAQSSTVICPTDSVSLNGTYAAGLTYAWYLNNNVINGATHDTIRVNPAGNYKIGVTNALGCVSFSPVITVSYLPAPASSITATGPLSFCQGSGVTLNGSVNSGVTYAWKLNGTYISGATTSSYTASSSGNYTLYENNGTCGTLSAPVSVSATAIPQAIVTTPGLATFCPGNTVTLNANTGNGYTYQWLLNSSTITGATTGTYTATAAGNYSVQVFSGPGCSRTSSLFPVSALPAPASVITPAGSTGICPGGTAVLDANVLPSVTYQWNMNNTALPGAISAVYAASTAGSYTLSVTAQNGCSTTSSPIVVSSLPAVNATITSNKPDTICAPDSVTLSVPTAAAVRYTWYAGSTVLNDTLSTLTVHATGDYSAQVANAGCSATSATVHVAVGTAPTGNIGYAAPGVICGSDPAILQAPLGAGYSYQWYLNNTPISSAFTPYYSASVAGTYTVKITGAYGCNYTPSGVAISTGTVPAPQIGQQGSSLCAPGYAAYQWNFNSYPLTGQTAMCTNIFAVGGYTVTVTNSTGCSATSSTYDVLNLGVNTVSKTDIKLYPNPASSVIYVDAPVAVNITVMSIEGKLLLHTENSKTVNIEHLPNGMYLLAVYDQDNNLLKTDKIVKE